MYFLHWANLLYSTAMNISKWGTSPGGRYIADIIICVQGRRAGHFTINSKSFFFFFSFSFLIHGINPFYNTQLKQKVVQLNQHKS